MELQFDNISKSYGATLALNRFSASLTPGIYAILGPNGSGKSTLMNILTGNLRADSGVITYAGDDGKAENILDMGGRFREKLGFMPQYPGMYPNFSVHCFLGYVAALKDIGAGQKRRERKQIIARQIEAVLHAVDLYDVRHRKIRALSGGMKQRLALAQAILGDPKILVLDEPTAGLDPKQRILIRNYISEIALNKIVLIATHVVSDVEFIAKEILMLKKGVLIAMGTPQTLLQQMENRVWELSVPETQISQYQGTYAVTNISKHPEQSGTVVLRVLSDNLPEEHAVPLSPTLEDYYLYTFGSEEGVPPRWGEG